MLNKSTGYGEDVIELLLQVLLLKIYLTMKCDGVIFTNWMVKP